MFVTRQCLDSSPTAQRGTTIPFGRPWLRNITFVRVKDGALIPDASHSKYLVPLFHELCDGQRDVSADNVPKLVKSAYSIQQDTVMEPSPTFLVRWLVPSPNNDLIAAITDTQELMVLDVARRFNQLQVPALKAVDAAAWNTTTTALAVFLGDRKKIMIIDVDKQQGVQSTTAVVYALSHNPREVVLSSAAQGIAGGRWLCVHLEATFTGKSSQFYRWDSATRGGGGAVGGFFPQPIQVAWDSTATVCALTYPRHVVFMAAQRKVFSLLSSADVRSEPLHIGFALMGLIVVLRGEVLLLLPTRSGVQRCTIAAFDGVAQSIAEFEPRVCCRPPGGLFYLGACEASFNLYFADAESRLVVMPLGRSLPHLLTVLNAAASKRMIASAPIAVVAAELLSAFYNQHRSSQRGILRLKAVETFAIESGCGELVANSRGGSGGLSASMCRSTMNAHLDDLTADVLLPLQPLLVCTVHAAGNGGGDDVFEQSLADRLLSGVVDMWSGISLDGLVSTGAMQPFFLRVTEDLMELAERQDASGAAASARIFRKAAQMIAWQYA